MSQKHIINKTYHYTYLLTNIIPTIMYTMKNLNILSNV